MAHFCLFKCEEVFHTSRIWLFLERLYLCLQALKVVVSPGQPSSHRFLIFVKGLTLGSQNIEHQRLTNIKQVWHTWKREATHYRMRSEINETTFGARNVKQRSSRPLTPLSPPTIHSIRKNHLGSCASSQNEPI